MSIEKEKVFIDKVHSELGFVMENPEKVNRAVYGLATSKGLVGGVGENAKSRVILDKYDELGGYITKDGHKVKTGCFFDRKSSKSIENPVIILVISVNGEFVEQVEGEPETLEVKIAKKQEKEKKSKKGKKVKDEE